MDNNIENNYFVSNFLISELQVQLNQLDRLENDKSEKIVKAIAKEISLFPLINSNLFPFEYINELKRGNKTPQLIQETFRLVII